MRKRVIAVAVGVVLGVGAVADAQVQPFTIVRGDGAIAGAQFDSAGRPVVRRTTLTANVVLEVNGVLVRADRALVDQQTREVALESGGFSPKDQLTVFGEVYGNARTDAAHEVSITTTLRNATGVLLRTTTSPGSSLKPDARSGVYTFIARMPLADLTPGRYVIHVKARGDVGDWPSASRDIQILVTD